uniref:Uncharacterized protein n=1 Tax=Arundo donax TaxID=35708 RepID=A0A0A9FWY3_ARUDO
MSPGRRGQGLVSIASSTNCCVNLDSLMELQYGR